MDKKSIGYIVLFVTLVLVLISLVIDMNLIKVKTAFLKQNSKFFAPLGYFIYVIYSSATSKK